MNEIYTKSDDRVSKRSGQRIRSLLIAITASIFAPLIGAQSFNSGSNGSDGALNLLTPGIVEFNPAAFTPKLDVDGDNVFHFTTITIGPGVTVRLSSKYLSGPVHWLASGAVKIQGTIDLSGEHGQDGASIRTSLGAARMRALPGPGGFAGGAGRYGDRPAQDGLGPGGGGAAAPYQGGGASHQSLGGGGFSTVGAAGKVYGNHFLVPLLGGSGGGGGSGSGELGMGASGGGGGGALLIASSVSINVTGKIAADGGAGGAGDTGGGAQGGAGGSGGAIHIIAPVVDGGGTITALGGGGAYPNGQGAGTGWIRLESFGQQFAGTSNPKANFGTPFKIYPLSDLPAVRAISVAGKPVPTKPGGTFDFPDVTINDGGSVTVQITAHNVPLGTKVKLQVISENGLDQTIDSSPLAGSLSASTASANVVLPPGFSRGYLRATW